MITDQMDGFNRFIGEGGSRAMSMICVSCANTVPRRGLSLGFRGQFQKLCRACHFSADEAMDQKKTEPDHFFESFISFTCDYGYIIGVIFFVWIVQVSLHRHDTPSAQVGSQSSAKSSVQSSSWQKLTAVKTSQLIPLLGP